MDNVSKTNIIDLCIDMWDHLIFKLWSNYNRPIIMHATL